MWVFRSYISVQMQQPKEPSPQARPPNPRTPRHQLPLRLKDLWSWLGNFFILGWKRFFAGIWKTSSKYLEKVFQSLFSWNHSSFLFVLYLCPGPDPVRISASDLVLVSIFMDPAPSISITFPGDQLQKSKVGFAFSWAYVSQWKWTAVLRFPWFDLPFYCKS